MPDHHDTGIISAFFLQLLGFKPIDWPRLDLSHKYGARENGACDISGNAGLRSGEGVGTLSSRFVILGKPFILQASISFILPILRTHRCFKHMNFCIDNYMVGEPEASEGEMLQLWEHAMGHVETGGRHEGQIIALLLWAVAPGPETTPIPSKYSRKKEMRHSTA